MAIPFKTLRYRSGTDQVWGIQLRRVDPPQERVDLSDAGAAEPGWPAGVQSHLVGRHAGRPRSAAGEQNLEIKPYAISRCDDRSPARRRRSRTISIRTSAATSSTASRPTSPPTSPSTPTSRRSRSTSSRSTSRASACSFRRSATSSSRAAASSISRAAAPARRAADSRWREGSADTPYLFYSRRIGLNGNRVIPIAAGGRLTGKVGAVRRRRHEHPDRRRSRIRHAGHQLHRRPRQARHPAAQHDRRDVHESFGRRCPAGGSNQAYGVDARVLVLPERQPRRLLGAHRAPDAVCATTTAIRRSSTTPPTATARARST